MSNNISLQKNKTGKRKLQSTSSKKRSEREKTPRKIKKKRRCRRMRAPWQLLGCAPPSPPPSGKKQSVMREWEKETGWGGGDGMTAGWMVGDGWNNGILARVPVCVSVCDILWLCVCVCEWGGGLMPRSWILQGPSLQQHLTFDLPAVLGSTHLQWPLEIKNINILMLTKECVCV